MGGSSAPAQPSTTTQIQDIPAWEQSYVTDLLGQAQTEAAQPYQQFPGPQIAGFTDDQNQSFSNVEGQTATNQANQAAALGQVGAGTNTANNIYGSGAGDINAATSYNPLNAVAPYLGAASQYNSAAAAQPGLNQSAAYNAASAGAASPLGISQYMSPYTNSVVGGIQNEANENWNQNIMPGVNNEFIGAGQGVGSGRNAQVLGQAAGNFQTGLSANVANALQSGYTTAGNQAATEAGILGQSANTALSGANSAANAQTGQITNLLNQANTAGTGTQQEAANLNTAGVNLGNLASTQASQQLNAGTALGALGAQDAATNLQQNQALNAVGLQQQQQNQTNLNTAQTNFENQVQYPEQQTQFLNQIIRGLPAPSASTSAGEVTAPTTSPLQTLGGAGLAGLSINANSNGTGATVAKRGGLIKGKKRGGIIKGYAEGGNVGTYGDDEEDSVSPLTMANMANMANMESMSGGDDSASASPLAAPSDNVGTYTSDSASPLDMTSSADNSSTASASDEESGHDDTEQASITPEQEENEDNQTSSDTSAPTNPLDISKKTAPQGFTPQMMQQQQLLALARGMLTPNIGGQVATGFGQGLGYMQDVTDKGNKLLAQQNNLQYQRQQDAAKLALEREKVDQGKYSIVPDQMGGFMKLNSKTGQAEPLEGAGGSLGGGKTAVDDKGNPLTGDAFLKTLDPNMANIVKGYANGSTQYPGSFSAMKPMWVSNILPKVLQYDPSANGQRFQNVQKFDTGQQGNQIRSLNTSIAHIDTAQQLADALNTGDIKQVNRISNLWKSETGQEAPTNFNTAKQIVANEVMKAISTSGAGGVADRTELQKQFDAAGSPAQLKGALTTAQKLLVGQASSYKNQYEDSTGRQDFLTRKLSPRTQAIYNRYSPDSSGEAPAAGDPVAARRAALQAALAAKQGGQ
jgi:hypothetical protein